MGGAERERAWVSKWHTLKYSCPEPWQEIACKLFRRQAIEKRTKVGNDTHLLIEESDEQSSISNSYSGEVSKWMTFITSSTWIRDFDWIEETCEVWEGAGGIGSEELHLLLLLFYLYLLGSSRPWACRKLPQLLWTSQKLSSACMSHLSYPLYSPGSALPCPPIMLLTVLLALSNEFAMLEVNFFISNFSPGSSSFLVEVE